MCSDNNFEREIFDFARCLSLIEWMRNTVRKVRSLLGVLFEIVHSSISVRGRTRTGIGWLLGFVHQGSLEEQRRRRRGGPSEPIKYFPYGFNAPSGDPLSLNSPRSTFSLSFRVLAVFVSNLFRIGPASPRIYLFISRYLPSDSPDCAALPPRRC